MRIFGFLDKDEWNIGSKWYLYRCIACIIGSIILTIFTIGFNIYLYLLYHSAVIFITLLPAALFVLYLSACAVFCYKRYKKAKIKNKRKIKNKINN